MAKVARPSFLARIRDAQKAKVVSFGARMKESFTYKLPEKYKNTWRGRVLTYWLNLLKDYKEASLDILRDIRDKPLKASVYGGLFGSAYFCAKRNPDQVSYRHHLLEAQNDVAFTCASIQNKNAVAYLSHLEELHNQGIIRYYSFGVVSIMWFDNYSKSLGLYEARCDYLKPSYLDIAKSRIVDVGFLNKWWFLNRNMIDFDVNDEEWSDQIKTN
ncbi:mitochondrial import inner membrane translocase subunit Tim29 [Cloeon dipterum]|uniref:mitochondrial import inner membrane translocase subunit Tim29 n=1 Tax=Cloeon dipterum TaxID=197152 RepID=UPI0032207B0F